uniref:Uncharacterized protein n=1 Tax=Anguilla anguilla TaxID=7936 RepID=A0A0E9VTV2_ANGAN
MSGRSQPANSTYKDSVQIRTLFINKTLHFHM